MLKTQFDHQIGRLISAFGKTHFSPERIDLIHRAVRGLTDAEFNSVIEHFLNTARQAPLPRDLAEAAMKERQRRFPGGARIADTGAEEFKCQTCRDGGMMVATHRESKREYFIHCVCMDFPHHRRNVLASRWMGLPVWHPRFINEFDQSYPDGKKWRPARFDKQNPSDSIAERVQEWVLQVELSRVFWGEYVAIEKQRQAEQIQRQADSERVSE